MSVEKLNKFLLTLTTGFIALVIQFFLIYIACPFFYEFNLQKDELPYQIDTLAKSGAWLWFNNENIIVDGWAIYIGNEDSKGNPKVNMYLFKNKNSTNKIRKEYPLSIWSEKERKYPSHSYPSLLKLTNGNLLATYHKASNKMYYRIAEVMDRGTKRQRLKWGPELSVNLNNGMNYNNLVQLSGENNRIFNFFSIFDQSPSVLISRNSGKRWINESLFMTPGKNGTSPYLKYADNGKDRIDIIYTDGHPQNEPNNNVYHIYYKEGVFYKSNGTTIYSLDKEARKEAFSPELGTKIYDGSNKKPGWVWDIEYDHQNEPVAAYISSQDGAVGNDLRYHYAKWDAKKEKWKQNQIAYAGTHIYEPENHFAGGITIDSENANVVYTSSDVNPNTGKPTKEKKYQIFRGMMDNNSNKWSWEQLTFDATKDNFRPVVPKNHNQEICVIWFRRSSDNLEDFDTEIVGILEESLN